MKRIDSMRKELMERFQFSGVNDVPFNKVEVTHENALRSVENHEQLLSQVKFPVYPISELHSPTKWKCINRIRFSDGGTFIADPEVEDNVPALLHLFASFVKYETRKKCTDWVKDPSVYDVLLAMNINFAQNSRIDSGYQILERCV